MTTAAVPRVIVVTRPSEYDVLMGRHGTRGQARFFLESRGQSIDEVERRTKKLDAALVLVSQGIPQSWRRSHVLRSDLDRFVWEPEDIVVVVGQDGLVANVAKYLAGQLVIGINPAPDLYDGVLVRHRVDRAARLIAAASRGRCETEARTMVEARTDDGQRLLALNEIFLGHRTHQSARYQVGLGQQKERQSSSGIIVSTGTGATGWARSIARGRHAQVKLPAPSDPSLVFFVREAFPSISTGTSLTGGLVAPPSCLEVLSEMNEGGVVFGDGIEGDRVDFPFGVSAKVGVAAERLQLVR